MNKLTLYFEGNFKVKELPNKNFKIIEIENCEKIEGDISEIRKEDKVICAECGDIVFLEHESVFCETCFSYKED